MRPQVLYNLRLRKRGVRVPLWAHVPCQSHPTTIPAPRCLHPCTMEIGSMETREPHRNHPSSSAVVLIRSLTEAIPAALQDAGERHNHETQLQNVYGIFTARGRHFCWSACGIQSNFRWYSNRSAAATARLRCATGLPRSRSRIHMDRGLLVPGSRPLRLARRLLDSSSV